MKKERPAHVKTVTLETLCGCSKELEWYGVPPREILVPVKRHVTFAVAEGEDPKPAIEIRRFELVDYADPFYRFREEERP